MHREQILEKVRTLGDGGFIEQRANNDPTNRWFPNEVCLCAMLWSAKFKNIRQLALGGFIFDPPRCEQDPNIPNYPDKYFRQIEGIEKKKKGLLKRT
jgi:hypothetical protein